MTVILQASQDFDIATLRSAIDGTSEKIAPGPALTLLLGAGYPGMRQIIEGILRDRSRDDRLRAHAVALISRFDCLRREEILLSRLGDNSPAVQLEAVKGLGRIGSAACLGQIRRFAASSSGRLGRQVALAALLVAARAGLPGQLFERPDPKQAIPVDGTCAEPASIRPVTREEFDAAITDLADEPLGIDYDKATALRITGADLAWILLLNTERRALFGRADANLLLGAVAEWDGSDDRWHFIYALVAGPSESDGTRVVAALDVGGEIALCGSLRAARNLGTFDLVTVSPVTLPVEIFGRIRRSGIAIDRFFLSRTHTGRRQAKRLQEIEPTGDS